MSVGSNLGNDDTEIGIQRFEVFDVGWILILGQIVTDLLLKNREESSPQDNKGKDNESNAE